MKSRASGTGSAGTGASFRKKTEQGFTLLELVVVLAVLGVVSLLAAQNLAGRQNQLRRERSGRGLEELREAICGRPGEREEDRGMCFVEDLGRLPRTVGWTNAEGEVWQSLGELVEKPSGVPGYGVARLRDAGTVCAAGGAAYDAAVDAGAEVWGGWRGPYALPGAGARAPWFRDGWGTAYAARAGGGSANRVSGDGSFADGSEGMTVAFLRHLGADAEPDGGAWARGGADDADEVADLRRATGAVARCTAAFSNASAAVFRLYVPCTCGGGGERLRAHILEARSELGGGDAGAENAFGAVFEGVPRGRWMYTAHPEGEAERTVRRWTRAE